MFFVRCEHGRGFFAGVVAAQDPWRGEGNYRYGARFPRNCSGSLRIVSNFKPHIEDDGPADGTTYGGPDVKVAGLRALVIA